MVLTSLVTASEAPAAESSAKSHTEAPRNRWERELERREAWIRRVPPRSPEAVLGLLGAFEELEGEVEPQRLRTFFDRVANDGRQLPLVRSFAGVQRALLDQAQGDREAARSRLEAEGYALAWQVVGPFDNANRKGEDAVYAPEQEPYRADQTFRGHLPDEPLGWRPVAFSAVPRGGFVSLDDLLRPNHDVTGYATSWVYVPRSTAAALHVGSGGPFTIWVDGQEIGRSRAYRAPHPLQDTFGVQLDAGWHRVLVKISTQHQAWGFFARWSRTDGTPIPAVRQRGDAPPEAEERHEAGPPTLSKPRPRVDSLRAALERAYRPGGKGPAGTHLLEFYRTVRPFDVDDDTAVRIARDVDHEDASARTAWLHALLEDDPNEAFAALRRGIQRARDEGSATRPLLGQMLLELAWRHQSIGMEDRYGALVDEASALLPDDAVIELEQIERLEHSGFESRAFARLEALAARHPHSSSLALARSGRLQYRGLPREALRALAVPSASGGILHAAQRIDLLLNLGEVDGAVGMAQAIVDASPGLPAAHAGLARLEESRGDIPAAVRAFEHAIALAPHDAELFADLGRMLSRHDLTAAAALRLRRSLELKPQQPAVRDLLATLEPETGSDMFRRHALALEDVAAQKTPRSWAGKSAGILEHKVAVRVLSNGLTERLDQRFVRILDDRGIRSEAVQGLVFDPSESVVEVRRARVHRRDGTIEDLGEVHVASMTSAGYRMYYDQRQIRVLFDGLRIGDTLEVAFVQRDIAARNMFDEYFGDVVPLQGLEPRRRVDYVLEAPKNKPIYFNLDGVERSETASGIVYRYVAHDVAAIKAESGMPGWAEVARFLHASTYRTWDDVGTWYWHLVAEQLVVDEDIRAAVRDALSGLGPEATVRDRVDAIYAYVVRNTRYVGLEFGIHGYKPYRTTEVLSRRFGDCKDKASLLKVMLGEAGIASHLVLVRTRDQGTVPATPASLSVFNHAITYVPSLDLYLDGTAEWSGPSELPSNDQGATVLVVKDGKGGDFRQIPVQPAESNRRVTEQVVHLHAGGSATVEHRFEVHGSAAASMRRGFAAQEQRDERLEAAFGDVYPGVQVERPAAPRIGDILAPAVIEATLEVPKWSRTADEGLRFWVLGRESSLTRTMAPAGERTHPLVLDVPSLERNHIRYILPSGLRFTKIPTSQTIESEVGRFKLSVEQTPDGAEVHSEIRLDVHRVSPKLYSEFRTFLRRVDEALDQSFEAR